MKSRRAVKRSTHRGVIRALMHKPKSAGQLARYLAVSPQALSRHLPVLRKAGLIAEETQAQDARVRIYSAHPVALEPVKEWLWMIEKIWREQCARASGTRRPAATAAGGVMTEDAARAYRMNSPREVAQAQPREHDTHACG